MRAALAAALLAATVAGAALASDNFQGLPDRNGRYEGNQGYAGSARTESTRAYRDWWDGLSRKEKKVLGPTVSRTSLHNRALGGGGESRGRNGASAASTDPKGRFW